MSSSIRWGILSTANIAGKFIRGLGLSCTSCVQAVASREWTRAYEWAKEHGVPRAFGSYEELLKSGEVDVIYNPLPNSLHAEWTIKALEAGLPVLCEKPFAIDAAEAQRMVLASEHYNVPLAEAFMYRFHPMYDRILDTIHEGAIGDIVTIYSSFAFRLGQREGNIRTSAELHGGALMDVGCYCVNLSRRMAGCEPDRAHAFERRTSVDDTLLGSLAFPNGILAHFECSIENHGHSRAEITGTDGAIVIPNPWFPGEQSARFILRKDGKEAEIVTEGGNGYHLEAEDFVRAFTQDEPPRWPAQDAVANMAVLDALYRSVETRRVESIENGA
ncbi:MAG TPA: Gfo/Idh/MocA family oxidoreductase [Candidatus Hydrogenedentes bacterium]|nr:Gfo/Idh/MocA family oxidoreductase [Candidatus Hydrogenedentota bacterium]HPG67301.1 Gfo/Idh/MocA family oxidoreductase [Candidatus Hydrogenedentota bacterium]